jgi:hypothetical protein
VTARITVDVRSQTLKWMLPRGDEPPQVSWRLQLLSRMEAVSYDNAFAETLDHNNGSDRMAL